MLQKNLIFVKNHFGEKWRISENSCGIWNFLPKKLIFNMIIAFCVSAIPPQHLDMVDSFTLDFMHCCMGVVKRHFSFLMEAHCGMPRLMDQVKLGKVGRVYAGLNFPHEFMRNSRDFLHICKFKANELRNFIFFGQMEIAFKCSLPGYSELYAPWLLLATGFRILCDPEYCLVCTFFYFMSNELRFLQNSPKFSILRNHFCKKIKFFCSTRGSKRVRMMPIKFKKHQ